MHTEAKKLHGLIGKPVDEILDVTRSYLSNSGDLIGVTIDVDFTHVSRPRAFCASPS